jgi:hypothetical protein
MRERIFNMLKETGLEVVYRTWDEGSDKPMPYICFRVVDTINFNADNISFCPVTNWAVELYSERKDDESEAKIEEVLAKAELPFNKYESQIQKGILEVMYLFSTIGE